MEEIKPLHQQTLCPISRDTLNRSGISTSDMVQQGPSIHTSIVLVVILLLSLSVFLPLVCLDFFWFLLVSFALGLSGFYVFTLVSFAFLSFYLLSRGDKLGKGIKKIYWNPKKLYSRRIKKE